MLNFGYWEGISVIFFYFFKKKKKEIVSTHAYYCHWII
jgi:hypothetical protein